ncbi:hypothetical protein KIH87_06235 [Paraneptunicella aestuarii]|uniref:hypothetical protein n=1 Tax=Paraneptunicella aestuarii TaxID=2831148 RepID=UPI001E2CDCA8|nr:hypothetical protein [Paraneptunicella aestuarii]UAA39948.1 hypothetical protein KIH87_06235 [Paraneptunicella aestuarii]
METVIFISLFAIAFVLQFVLETLGKTKGWQFANRLLNDPEGMMHTHRDTAPENIEHHEITALKERIQVLEKLITDQAFDMKKSL